MWVRYSGYCVRCLQYVKVKVTVSVYWNRNIFVICDNIIHNIRVKQVCICTINMCSMLETSLSNYCKNKKLFLKTKPETCEHFYNL